jgi:hypothetical protein
VSKLHRGAAEQLDRAYRQMATEARYRPAAPSDGFGNITAPLADLDLDAESEAYARAWWAEEDSLSFHVGCCEYQTREATVYLIEAARALCAGNRALGHALLRLAASSLDEAAGQRHQQPKEEP